MKIYNVGEMSPPQSFLDQQSNCGDTWLVTDYFEVSGLHCGTGVSLNEQTLFIFSFDRGSDPIRLFGLNQWSEERKYHSDRLVAKVDELLGKPVEGNSTGSEGDK